MSKEKAAGTILKMIIEKAWPWIKKVVLPLLKEAFKAIIAKFISKMQEKSNEAMDKHMDKQRSNATAKANEAKENAVEASTESEKAEYEAIEKVWRVVAEELRKENEELKATMKNLIKETEESIISETQSLDPNIDADGQIKIGK